MQEDLPKYVPGKDYTDAYADKAQQQDRVVVPRLKSSPLPAGKDVINGPGLRLSR